PGTVPPRRGSREWRRSRRWWQAARQSRHRRHREFAVGCRRSLSLLLPRKRHGGTIKAYFDRACGGRPAFQNHRRAHTIRRSSGPRRSRMADNKNVLYLIIGVLLVAVGVLSYNLYQARQQPEGLQINVGPDGLKIRNK